MHFSTSYSFVAVSVLAATALAQSDRDTLNDINDLCYVNFSEVTKTIVCTLDGTSNVFTDSATSFLRGSDEHICCKSDNTCVKSNDTNPRVGCFDPTKKAVNVAQDIGPCDLKDGSCAWIGATHDGSISFSTKGVTKYSSVKDGKGVEGSGSGTPTSSSSSSTSTSDSSGSVVYASYLGTLSVALLSIGASVLL